MNSYEFLQIQVNERRAQVEREFAGHRFARAARRAKARTWLRRSARTIPEGGSVATTQPITGVVPAPGTAAFHEWAAALGLQLAERGARMVETPLRAVARRAMELNVEPVLAGVLADRRETEVARTRAFAVVVSALAAIAVASGAELAATA